MNLLFFNFIQNSLFKLIWNRLLNEEKKIYLIFLLKIFFQYLERCKRNINHRMKKKYQNILK